MGIIQVIKLVLDGTVNSKFDDEDKAQKVVSLVFGFSEYSQFVSTPPLNIRRRYLKHVTVTYNGESIFDKPFVDIAYDSALVITFKPYKDSSKYVEKLRTLLGGEVYERVTKIARRSLDLGGTIHRGTPLTEEFSLDEIEAIVAQVTSAKSFRLAITA